MKSYVGLGVRVFSDTFNIFDGKGTIVTTLNVSVLFDSLSPVEDFHCGNE